MPVPAAVTAARVKTYLGIPSGVTQHDSFLDYLAQEATEHVAHRLGLTAGLTVNSYSETLDVDYFGQDRVRVSAYPIVSVAALTDDGNAVALSDLYVHRSKRWIVLKGAEARFSDGKQKVQVTYTAGWDEIPYTVSHAITLACAFHFNRAPKTGLDSEKIGSYTVSIASGDAPVLPPDAEVLLAEHVSPVAYR